MAQTGHDHKHVLKIKVKTKCEVIHRTSTSVGTWNIYTPENEKLLYFEVSWYKYVLFNISKHSTIFMVYCAVATLSEYPQNQLSFPFR